MNNQTFNALCANLDFLTIEELMTVRDICNNLLADYLEYPEEPDDIDDDCGFNPYTGCFDEDC